jgi:hypothetical protein
MRLISVGQRIVLATAMLCAMALAGVLTSPAASARADSGRFTVCSNGCTYKTIQAAVNAASPGAIITIGPGHYSENVTLSTSVTLKGAGQRTIVYPAVSNPNPNGCSGSLCGGSASNIMLVAANNVTIENMKLEGANPALAGSGITVNGASINARNGIIEDFPVGTFAHLTVTNVTVQDIFLRGIEAVGASSGETFTFSHDKVTNVEGNPNLAIAMFNSMGSGSFTNDTVTEASDAISANWSQGTLFEDNVIKNSASGIHTDNNGGAGGTADKIDHNKVRSCTKDGYGIWVFAPYLSATVDHNTVKGCYVGLGAYGSQAAGQGPTFSNNSVSGVGATTSYPNGTYGAYVTTDMLGFGCADVQATLSGNTFQHSTTGLLVTQTSPTNGDSPCSFQATVAAHNNAVFKTNTNGANGLAGTVFDATNNWWGCPKGPNTPGCSTATGTTAFRPWLTKKPPRS